MSRTGSCVLATLLFTLAACAPVRDHKPRFYPIEQGEIRTLELRGNIHLANGYPEREPVKLGATNAFGGGEYKGDLAVMTHQFTQQFHQTMRSHIDNHEKGSDKLITARITEASYRNRGAYHECRLSVRLELGDEGTVEFDKVNNSPQTSTRAINGAVAVAVIEALEHPDVRAYLEE